MSGFVKMFFTVLLLRELKCSPPWCSVAAWQNRGDRQVLETLQNAAFILLSKRVVPWVSPFLALARPRSALAAAENQGDKDFFSQTWTRYFARRVTRLRAALVCGVAGSVLGFLSSSVLCCMLIAAAAAAVSRRCCCECTLCWCRHHNRKHLGLS